MLQWNLKPARWLGKMGSYIPKIGGQRGAREGVKPLRLHQVFHFDGEPIGGGETAEQLMQAIGGGDGRIPPRQPRLECGPLGGRVELPLEPRHLHEEDIVGIGIGHKGVVGGSMEPQGVERTARNAFVGRIGGAGLQGVVVEGAGNDQIVFEQDDRAVLQGETAAEEHVANQPHVGGVVDDFVRTVWPVEAGGDFAHGRAPRPACVYGHDEGDVGGRVFGRGQRSQQTGQCFGAVIGGDGDGGMAHLLLITGALSLLGDDLSLLGDDLSLLGGDLPLLGGDLPLLGGDLPLLGDALPLLGGDLPLLGDDLPLLGDDLPLLGDDLSLLGGDLSLLRGYLPLLRGYLPLLRGVLPFLRGAGSWCGNSVGERAAFWLSFTKGDCIVVMA